MVAGLFPASPHPTTVAGVNNDDKFSPTRPIALQRLVGSYSRTSADWLTTRQISRGRSTTGVNSNSISNDAGLLLSVNTKDDRWQTFEKSTCS